MDMGGGEGGSGIVMSAGVCVSLTGTLVANWHRNMGGVEGWGVRSDYSFNLTTAPILLQYVQFQSYYSPILLQFKSYYSSNLTTVPILLQFKSYYS